MKPLCVVSCPIDTFSGYGARSRDFVNALIKDKDKEWDIKIMPQRWGECPWNYLSKDDPLRKRFISRIERQPDIWYQITVPNEFQPIGKFNIGVTAGIETNVFPANFLDGFNRMHLNLVSSEHSKRAALTSKFEKRDKNTNELKGEVKCEKPVEVLFEGLDLENYYKKPNKSDILKNVDEEFCFLYTGHWLPGNMGEDRKNTGLLIKTFLETFNGPGTKKPALILKCNEVNYSILDKTRVLQRINKIRKQYGGKNAPNIYLLHGEMTTKEMNELNNHSKVKVFINLTKGEGFGRPLLEAAITGKPIIATNWSGHIDFLKGDYNILIGGELKPVHETAANQFLLKESQWFSPDIHITKKAMKNVFKQYKFYLERSRKQTQYIKNHWNLDKMAERIEKYLPEIKPQPQTVSLNMPDPNKLPTLKKSKTKNNSGNPLPTLKKLQKI